MAKFAYIARSSSQETRQGTVEANSSMEAVEWLSKQGYFPLTLQYDEASLPARDKASFWSISQREVVALTRQLAMLLGSGVNIITGLSLLKDQVTNQYLKAVVAELQETIQRGSSLSQALAAYPQVFSPLYLALVRSGEIAGRLDETLVRLSDFLEKEAELREEFLAALTYPLFIAIVGAVTLVVLIGFVMPKLVVMFNDMGQSLPLPTILLIGLSDLMRSSWWFLAIALGGAVFAFYRYYNTPEGRLYVDERIIKTLYIKDIVVKTEIGRFMRTFALLLSSGIEAVTALDVAGSVFRNSVLKNEALGFKGRIMKGDSLSQCLKGSQRFPPFVTNIVAVGEEAGELEQALVGVAKEYEREADRLLKTLTRLLEPAIILVMGLVIGFIVMAMLLPIFEMNLMAR